MERLLDRYVLLLEQLVEAPDSPFAQHSLMDASERELLLESWNATSAEFPERAIHLQFEARVDADPEAIALHFPGEASDGDLELSYAELDQRANRLAHYLRQRGVEPGALVGVCLERSPEMLVSVLATSKCGAAYVPLDPSYPAERIDYMARDAALTHAVTSADLRPLLAGDVQAIVVDEEAASIASQPGTRPDVAVAPSDRIYVIYTSGSTGRPKGVELEHRSVSNFLASMAREPGFSAGERLLAVTTLSFDISVLELLLPLVKGGTVILAPGPVVGAGDRLRELLERVRPDVMQATPATWKMLLLAGWEAGAPGSDRLRVFSGGEALARDLADELLARAKEVWNLYGPTETTIWSAVARVLPDERAIAVGRPIANTRAYVLDKLLQPLPMGATGELWIAGAGLARGYLDRPELTAERFLRDPFVSDSESSGRPTSNGSPSPMRFSRAGEPRMYRTGDLARWVEAAAGDSQGECASGELQCLGRVDNQVKLRGFRIEMGEIEALLSGVAGVRECVAVVREDRPGDQRLTAYCVCDEVVDASVLRAAARESLPAYMVPAAYAFVDALPLTPNGKVDRRALQRLAAPQADAPERGGFTPPKDETEARVAEVWKAVLGVEQVAVTANFFDLGGHSLLLAQVRAELQEVLERELTIIELFQYPTVRLLAQHLGGSDSNRAQRARGKSMAAHRRERMATRRRASK